jgi:DNA (cytosine-5)-methyltransferase 1
LPEARSVLSLFTGAGGLDIGLEAAGFKVAGCVEIDPASRKTVAANRPQWPFLQTSDIADIRPKELPKILGVAPGSLSLIAGGPPCQPFSKSGYWANGDTLRLLDPRASTFKQYFEIVRALLPEVFLLENVQGIRYRQKSEALDQILAWTEELNSATRSNYDPMVLELNAPDYGVPQTRRRVFVVAHREGSRMTAPMRTHGETPCHSSLLRYTNAWDAIGDLDSQQWDDSLEPRGKWAQLLPSIPEGSNYLWHTDRGGGQSLFGWRTRYWSFLLKLAKAKPSWTIQASPGPSTGPFHWRSRQLSIQELLRLQTFPDGFTVCGTRQEGVRQIGNAVPPLLAEILGRSIRTQLLADELVDAMPGLGIQPRDDCPPPLPPSPLPHQYKALVGDHEPHPGIGLGPGAAKREDGLNTE